MSTEQTEFEATIVDACTKREEAHWRDSDDRASICIGTKYLVKCATPAAHPKVQYFRAQENGYVVMEYINLMPSPPALTERTTQALRSLSDVPAPSGHVISPLGDGLIRHGFFKDNEAPLHFSSVEALEQYIEKGRTMLLSLAKNTVQPVSISGDRLIFTQSDMDISNFGVDEHGNTILLDFAQIVMLPESFAAYSMSSKDSLVGIAESLGWSRSSNR
ncbi:hypothetical protein NP233_g866 [Leucocoprinus birnbaumii]|uniref:Aminoglycoside phosphotransferase domain-containing protein n=1 Tax=Leucocoprinus birnbaumii TaxID=56174 RepID=A0AAD5W123_9AGAR|nr:hypothetical protein NP233_g866 [Leucocoprinus birnbaumii]